MFRQIDKKKTNTQPAGRNCMTVSFHFLFHISTATQRHFRKSYTDANVSMLNRGKNPRCAPTGSNAHYIAFDIAIDNTACYYSDNTNVRPRTGHERPEALRYSSTLSLTSALGRGGWLTPRPGCLTLGKWPGTYCTGGWVVPGPVWTDSENLARSGIRYPDRPARSESLCRLSYHGPHSSNNINNININNNINGIFCYMLT
jgi:hypothetical protein